ncbi:roadblock/LC7 domain-containing protein, partial [Nonomuraea sp. NPDC049129]|uniref:roadblock/LC7 domain-containing protein n=1 Tax=Nonomuraea sp. NPDC049129 TaxID=3155272 RepID=UPI0033D03241
MTPGSGTDLNWLLDDLIGRVKEAEHAIVLSSDGLLMASSAALPRPSSRWTPARSSDSRPGERAQGSRL